LFSNFIEKRIEPVLSNVRSATGRKNSVTSSLRAASDAPSVQITTQPPGTEGLSSVGSLFPFVCLTCIELKKNVLLFELAAEFTQW
jgi:hypothetical protein